MEYRARADAIDGVAWAKTRTTMTSKAALSRRPFFGNFHLIYSEEVSMPKFFFRYRTGDQLAPDLEGTELPSRAAARKMAFESARELVADAIKAGRPPPDAVIVTDEDGREIMTIPTSEVLPAPLKK